MCRLYGFFGTEPTKVECTLVHAQNALISQSRSDLAGYSHSHGWGVATFDHAGPDIERQAWAAYHGEHFARAAAQIYSRLVIAHVRRATVGGAAIENTHPFSDGRWVFAHNGTVPNFADIRPVLRERMTPGHRQAIQGETDSEHVFRYFLTLVETGAVDPEADLAGAIRRLVGEMYELTEKHAPGKKLGFNIILSDGQRMAGSRLNRTLHYVDRQGVYDCEICGFPHIHHDPKANYRAIVVASEPLTHEEWIEIPNGSIWQMSATDGIIVDSLGLQNDLQNTVPV
ncbi:class II glutamine amidotransferase [Parasphingorhabdus sp.]|uniref:class II glutamine amidotransferase n=1 Tax=Parasphingorhabdus sp. TaxID=2709688 RepID=UPI003A8E0936